MRYAALLCVLLLAGCKSKSTADEKQLAIFQHNAKLYFDDNKLDQALLMADRGLALEPEDYQLQALRGAILLKQSMRTAATDPKLLQDALDQFERIQDERSMARHQPYFVFYSALALQKKGMRHIGEATRLLSGADHAADPADQRAKAEQQADLGNEALGEARARLEVMLERGELQRHCHYHLMQIAATQRRAEDVIAHGERYLATALEDQKKTRAQIEATQTKGWEDLLRRELDSLRKEEIATRSFLADFHHDRKEYQAARAHLDALLQLDPARSNDYYNRGRVLIELGEVEAAKADFRRFLATSALPADSPKKTEAITALAR